MKYPNQASTQSEHNLDVGRDQDQERGRANAYQALDPFWGRQNVLEPWEVAVRQHWEGTQSQWTANFVLRQIHCIKNKYIAPSSYSP